MFLFLVARCETGPISSLEFSSPRDKLVIIITKTTNSMSLKKIKPMAYNSQGSNTFNENSASDWQMAARRDNVISITLHQVY